MKIVYFITTVGHGKGGHFHSLNTIANSIGATEEVYIVNIGYKPSEVLDKENYDFAFFRFNGFNFISTYSKIKKYLKEIGPDAIHAFDVESFAFSRLFSKQFKKASIINKCGGPNPKKYYPKPNHLILFSKENKVYFENQNSYKSTHISLIPNRVKKVTIDNDRIRQFYEKHGHAELSLLRIARIGKHYHKSILQAINLMAWLKTNGLKARLIVIGTIQSKEVYDNIREYVISKQLENDVIIETSDTFTHNASGLLDVGDIIIGTGRNFMEASSLNKVLLVPYKDSDYPLLVTDKNFEQIFATNFSPRTQVPNYDRHANLVSIKKQSNARDAYNSINWFNQYFNVENGVEKYKQVYLKKEISKSGSLFDTLVNIIYAIKTFVLK